MGKQTAVTGYAGAALFAVGLACSSSSGAAETAADGSPADQGIDAAPDTSNAMDAREDEAAPTTATTPVPRGIFALGIAQDMPQTPGDDRLSNVRDYDFVAGFTLRLFWRDLHPQPGAFDFAVVDAAVARVQMNRYGRGLNIEIFATEPPAWVVTQAGETNGGQGTWQHFRGGPQPVPWDPGAQRAWSDLMQALASHPVADAASGSTVPFAEHPVLVSVDSEVVGIGGIRDNAGAMQPPPLAGHPDYQRQRFIDAVLASVGAARAAFPHRVGFLAYFAMKDGQDADAGGTSLDQALLGAIGAAYNGPGQPALAIFQELLSDLAPAPTSPLGQNLTLAHQHGAPVMFQALTSWLHPFTSSTASVASRNPATGIERGFTNWDARYYELYVSDLDDANSGATDAMGRAIVDDLRAWKDKLTAP